MRLLVCGGRDYNGRGKIWKMLRFLKPSCVIHGGAHGADALAAEACNWLQIPQEVYEAEWELYGKSAGPKRNQRMIDEGKPDLILAFPGGRGTADMVKRGRECNIEVQEVREIS